jgi:putative hydrolase of the HAD superfamily
MRQDLEELGGDNPAFWARYTERQLRAVGCDGGTLNLAQTITGLFNDRYRPRDHIPADVAPTLARLRGQGYTVGLVSNRRDPLETLVAELGLAGQFALMLSAGQAGYWKPDPRIFHRAAELAGCGPETCVYVGDNYYADIEGAEAAGLHPILIDPLGLFPEARCPVIRAVGEIESALAQLQPQSAA